MKPMLVGETNPYGGDDRYALYPAPDGCSGHRLCCLILGMYRRTYLEAFDRCNLVRGEWSIRAARERAAALLREGGPLILLGSKVCAAAGVIYEPFTVRKSVRNGGREVLVLPHPSGLCRAWYEPGAFERARQAVAQFVPEVAEFLGVAQTE